MSGADRLDASFPHGTPAGARLGCKGSICSGREQFGISCAEALMRYRGDFTYRKRVDAGMTPAEIAALEAEEQRAAIERERAERRAVVAAQRAQVRLEAQQPVAAAVVEVIPGVTKRGGKGRPWTADEIRALRELAGKMSDTAIGREIGRPLPSVWAKRRELDLPAFAGRGPQKAVAS